MGHRLMLSFNTMIIALESRLVSGVLQLAEGSHLTIDETQLQAGILNFTGVDNARTLKNLVELQKVIFILCQFNLVFKSLRSNFYMY